MNKLNHVAIIMDGNGRWGLKKKKIKKLWSCTGIKNRRNHNQGVNLE